MDKDREILIAAIAEQLRTAKYETLRTIYLILVHNK